MAADLTLTQMYECKALAGDGTQQEVALTSCERLQLAADGGDVYYAWTDGDIASGDYQIVWASTAIEIPIPATVDTIFVLSASGTTARFDSWDA